jgi:hypothetical protein
MIPGVGDNLPGAAALRAVALIVVSVGKRAIRRQSVVAAGGVARVGAVARRIITTLSGSIYDS